MKTLLWLDDIRDPFENDGEWLVFSPFAGARDFKTIWVKSYEEFCNWIKENGLPDGICFDHDLGEDVAIEMVKNGTNKKVARKVKKELPSGFDCAKYVVEYCIKHDVDIPRYNIQSANPVGKDNINGLLQSYSKFRLNNK
jgi:hypothetical protein